METSPNHQTLPKGYVPLPGSELRPGKTAKLLGPANEAEEFKVTIVLRRRTDGEPIPDFDYFAKTPFSKRRRLENDVFASRYGAHPDDTAKVVKFAEAAGLKIIQTHAARRTVVASGTVALMSKAFHAQLGRYEHTVINNERRKPAYNIELYRGRDGFVYLPEELTGIIIGVFGLDTRRISRKNFGDPPNSNPLSVQHVTQLYNFPTNSAAGQTIAIFSEDGYTMSDIVSSFNGNPPVITDIPVDQGNNGQPDAETTQDIYIAASAAPGADIAVFFTTFDEVGWVDAIEWVIHPYGTFPSTPYCSVFSTSYSMIGNEENTLVQNWFAAVHMAFQDAAIQGVTMCTASGDFGSDSYAGDGKAHVGYPESDPWVLGVGGTTIGNIVGNNFDEYVWNDSFISTCEGMPNNGTGATGGGVSTHYDLPSYQIGVGVPASVNDGHIGRGVPDVAANASPSSGYPFTLNGLPCVGNGTSGASPLWAGLIALINASLGESVGFINPLIYQIGSAGFRDIVGAPGPVNNAYNGAPGYPATTGWDACTGWGSPNGMALLNEFQTFASQQVYISGGYQSADIILTDLSTNMPVPIGGQPGGPWDTLLKPNTNYGLSANIHNVGQLPSGWVEVRFWAIPGGVGTNGTMIGQPQMIDIPGNDFENVTASASFTSAGPGEHMCAVVSLYYSEGACTTQATTALQIPDPGQTGSRSCSAWRNTDSMFVSGQQKFSFNVGLGELIHEIQEPILIELKSVHVPARYTQLPKVREITETFRRLGSRPTYPLYLLPEIRENLRSMHLKANIEPVRGASVEKLESNRFHVFPERLRENISLNLSGEIPADAHSGDIVLVYVTANYPRMGDRKARAVEFLEFLYVRDEVR